MLLPALNVYAGLAALVVAGFIAGTELRRLLTARAPLLGALVTLQLLVGMLALYVLVVRGPGGYLLALLPTWAADVGAYAIGSVWGTHKIAPSISPGKSWEGTVAGVIAAAAAAMVVGAAFGMSTATAAIAACLVGPAGFAGDLIESAAKRRAGVKDSGALLPGHGGVLDRIDSLLLAAPAVVIALLVAATLMR